MDQCPSLSLGAEQTDGVAEKVKVLMGKQKPWIFSDLVFQGIKKPRFLDKNLLCMLAAICFFLLLFFNIVCIKDPRWPPEHTNLRAPSVDRQEN